MKHFTLNLRWLIMSLVLCVGGGTAWGGEVTDVLNQALTCVTGTNYTEWSVKTATSDAVYAGQSAGGNKSIQLRSSNNNSGIVTTTSGGKVKSITVEWNNNTTNGRTLNIYGKNSAYSAATDLYNTSNQGTLLGTIVNGTSTSLTVSGDYEYIGIRSASGALYLTSVSIVWESTNNKTTPELSWSESTYTAILGQTTVFPSLIQSNVESGTLSFSSSNEAVATISSNGAIELKSKGSTTITATAAGTATQNEFSASYTLNVNNPPIAGVLFNETFDLYDFSGGRDGQYSGNGVASGTFKEETNDEHGWTADRCNGASQCVKFGSSNDNATLTTRSISLSGNGTLTFSAAGWGSGTNTLTVSATGGTLEGTTSFTLTNGSWTDYTINIAGGTGNLVLTFSGKRGFIDEIMVVNASGKNFPGLAFEPNTPQTLVVGETADVAFSKNTTEEVTFSFNPEGIASYDAATGTLTALAAGTTVLTASAPEGENYAAGTATLSVTVNKKAAGISFAKSSYVATLDGGFETPAITNPNELTVTYASSDPEIAAVDASTGSVTVKAVGEVTITATTAETAEYEAGEASYTLTITNDAPVVFKKVTKSAEIVSGMEYILVATGNNKAMGGQNNADYRSSAAVTITSNTVIVTADMGVAILTLTGNDTDGWTALAADNGKYLSFGDKKLKSVDEKDATKWAITDDFQMKSGDDHTIQYNSGSPRFACYSSNQAKVYLFVKETKEIAFTNETAEIWNGTTYTNTLVNVNGLEGTYSSSNEAVATVNATTGEATALHRGNTTISFSWETQTKNGKEIEAGEVTYVLTVKNPETFKKVTNISEVVAGKEYILVATGISKAIGEENSNNSNRKGVSVTIENDKVTVMEKSFTVFTLGGSTDAWTFQANDNSKYLALTLDANYLEESEAVGTENKQEWTVTKDFNVVNKAYNNRTIGSADNNGNSFATYTNNSDGKEYAVLFVKMPDAFDVKITAAKMGTLYVGDGNLVVPEGVTAQTLKLDANGDGTALVASREYKAGDVLPAGEAVIIYGEAGDYSFEYTTDEGTFGTVDAENLLKGSDTATTDNEEGYSYYTLGVINNVAGFYRQTGTEAKSVKSAAHKAYLKVPNAGGEVKSFYVLGGDTTTGVTAIETSDRSNNVVYNLAGQRVSTPTKGLYIVNGKKVFIK